MSIIEKLSTLSQKVLKDGSRPAALEIDLLKHYLLEAYDELNAYRADPVGEIQEEPPSAPTPGLSKETVTDSPEKPIEFSQNHVMETQPTEQDEEEAGNEEAKKEEQEAEGTINERFKSDVPLISDKAADRGDLRKIIDLNKRYLYVNELFGGDESAYDRAIAELNNLPDYQRAAKYVAEQLEQKLDWSDKKKYRDMFYRSVQKRFGMKGDRAEG